MRLVLADPAAGFDALAAQLAATCLFPDSYAVLDQKLSDSVRGFLASHQFPALHHTPPAAAPAEVILIAGDALPFQPLPTLIIAQRPLPRPLQPHERLLTAPAAAATTLLVLRLIEAQQTLSVAEATLMLLGIYAASEGLSAPATTSSDRRCVAWLLNQGGDVAAVDAWLHPIFAPLQQLAGLLEQALPADVLELMQRAAAIADAQGYPLYIVGGVVRDLLLGQSNSDFDLLVEGDAIAVATALAQELGGELHSYPQFGTATVGLPQTESAPARLLDIVGARSEVYPQPAALPQVQPASLAEDLLRRDFTVNTLAMCLSSARYGWLYDFYGGQHDIQAGYIRVLHALSFIDDPTRLLRGVRLAARLDFSFEPQTRALIDEAVAQHMLQRTTPARILHELALILREEQPERALALLAELGLLRALHPALHWSERQALRFAAAREAAWPDVALRDLYVGIVVYALTDADRAAISAHYRLAAPEARLLRELGEIQQLRPVLADPATPASTLDRALQRFLLSSLRVAQLMEAETTAAAIARYCDQLRPITTALGGRDLLALGLKPGPQIGQLLAELRAARLDGTISDEAGERAWIAANLQRSQSSS